MSADKNKPEKEGTDPTRKYDKEYPENGDNHAAGTEEDGPLPNNPAKNAEKTSPEEDEKD